MKNIFRIVILVVSIFTLLTHAPPALAENYYMGIAVDYALAGLDGEFEPEDSLGINFRSGSMYADWLSMELNIDYLPEFKDKSTIRVSGSPVGAGFDMEILTFLLDVKLTPDIIDYNFRPILFFGVGWMISEAKSSLAAESYLKTRDIDDSDFCVNFGLGVEYRISDIYSFDLKTSYVKGMRDVSDVKFVQCALGLSYYF